jgi:hypothetical protein
MAIYEPLGRHLKKNAAIRVPMTFKEVEAVIGRKLPTSAYRHRPWWANEARGHSHAKAWLLAGYVTEQVDMSGKKLVFVRAEAPRGMAEETKTFIEKDVAGTNSQHPLVGCMEGTFTIEPGWDLTKPALDPDELAEWEAKLDRMADDLQQRLSQKS